MQFSLSSIGQPAAIARSLTLALFSLAIVFGDVDVAAADTKHDAHTRALLNRLPITDTGRRLLGDEVGPAVALLAQHADAGDPVAQRAIATLRYTNTLRELQSTLEQTIDRETADGKVRARLFNSLNTALASVALINRDNDTAVHALKRNLRLDPNDGPTLTRLGVACSLDNKVGPAGAWFQQALEHEHTLSPSQRVTCLSGLAVIAKQQGRNAESRKLMLRLLDAQHAADDRGGYARTLHALADLDRREGDLDQAQARFETAMSIFVGLDDPRGVAISLLSMGKIAENRGDLRAAMEHFLQAAEAYRRAGDTRGLALASSQIGHVAKELGDPDIARQAKTAALALQRVTDGPVPQERSLLTMADLAADRRDYGQAHTLYEQALQLARRNGNLKNQAIAHGAIGLLYTKQRQYTRAAHHHVKALEINRQLDDPSGQAYNLYNIARTHELRDDDDQAMRLFSQALAMAEHCGDQALQGTTLNAMGNLAHSQHKHDQATDYLTRSYQINQRLGLRRDIAINLMNLGLVCKSRGNLGQAKAYISRAVAIHRTLNDRYMLAMTLDRLAGVLTLTGEHDQAGRHYAECAGLYRAIGRNALAERAERRLVSMVAE